MDNKTITKLAIAITTVMRLYDKEVVGPLTRKVLETLDTIDSMEHFKSYTPKAGK